MPSNLDYHKKISTVMPTEYLELFEFEDNFLKEVVLPGTRTCDIGSGYGRAIASILGSTDHIVGVDVNKQAIDELTSIYPECTFVNADAAELPFAQGEFDMVLCMMSRINFGDKKERALDEMYRVVRNGGKLVLSAFHEDALETRMTVYTSLDAPIKEVVGGTVLFAQDFEGNTSEQFTQQELVHYITSAGFTIISITRAGVGYVCYAQKPDSDE